MKNIIILLFTIILAVYIGTTYIVGDGGDSASFLEVAEEVSTKANGELTKITNASIGDD